MINFIALTSAGIEPLLAEELEELGASEVRVGVQSVRFSASFSEAQHICMWTRLSTRILRDVMAVSCKSKEDIYEAVLSYDWHPYFVKIKTFSVEFVGTDKNIRNTQFGALVIKDAIVDNIREETGKRPDIDKSNPDLTIQGRLFKGKCHVYVDFSGASLHQRGFRQQQGSAPLKEHLAAAIIRRSGWDKQTPLVDLFAGSGTLLIEAAHIHMNKAPGLSRRSFPFFKHPEFRVFDYDALREQTLDAQTPCNTQFIGFDIDQYVLEKAAANIELADLEDVVQLGQQDAAKAQVSKNIQPGWIVSNPPYGERIGDSITLLSLFKRLGFHLKTNFENWHLSILTGQPTLLKLLKLQKSRDFKFKNGALEVLLTNYHLTPKQCEIYQADQTKGYFLSKDGQAFSGRLDKNIKRLSKWVKKENIRCYRLYDADIPEYNVAVDYYDGRIVVYEYQAPKSVNPTMAEQRLLDVLSIVQEKFNLSQDNFALKVRKSQKGTDQYQKENSHSSRFAVIEDKAQLYVNIHDYLDTGLFLDHRATRLLFSSWCSGKDVLNLFCYTGSVSVHAALAGAKRVTSVDMSNTYFQWAEDNFELNKIDKTQHYFHRADCLEWLTKTNARFDLIFLDPPSFSNSKKMNRTWDVQRDYLEILELVKARLKPQGQVLFSNNLRQFKFDDEAVSDIGFDIEDITKQTIPPDFERNNKIHHCWKLSLRTDED